MKLKHIHQKKRYAIVFNMNPSGDSIYVMTGYGKSHTNRLVSKFKSRFHDLYGHNEKMTVFINEIGDLSNRNKYGGEKYRNIYYKVIRYYNHYNRYIGAIRI